jgi:hypothetical protein
MFDHNSCSATVSRYIETINTLFWLHNLDIPADLGIVPTCVQKSSLPEREKRILQGPIMHEMFSALLELAKKLPVNLLEAVVADWFTLIRITGLHISEYAQKTQSEVDKYKYPLGECVVESFTSNDWKFYNSKGLIINIHTLKSKPQEFLTKPKITFQIQKNRKNGQSITLVANNVHLDICPVRAAYRIFLHAKRFMLIRLRTYGRVCE